MSDLGQQEFEGMPQPRRSRIVDPRLLHKAPKSKPDTPGQASFNPNLSGFQFRFTPSEGHKYGERTPHVVEAIGPTGGLHGALEWHPSHGEIKSIVTHPAMGGRGIATAMWHRAHAVSQATRGTPPMQGQGKLFDAGKPNRIIPPRHSSQRTEKGNQWAHKVGGYLPPWQKVEMEGY